MGKMMVGVLFRLSLTYRSEAGFEGFSSIIYNLRGFIMSNIRMGKNRLIRVLTFNRYYIF